MGATLNELALSEFLPLLVILALGVGVYFFVGKNKKVEPTPVPAPAPIPEVTDIVIQPQPPSTNLKEFYVDRDELMKSLGALNWPYSVIVDDKEVHAGFGPSDIFYTLSNGMVTKHKPAVLLEATVETTSTLLPEYDSAVTLIKDVEDKKIDCTIIVDGNTLVTTVNSSGPTMQYVSTPTGSIVHKP